MARMNHGLTTKILDKLANDLAKIKYLKVGKMTKKLDTFGGGAFLIGIHKFT